MLMRLMTVRICGFLTFVPSLGTLSLLLGFCVQLQCEILLYLNMFYLLTLGCYHLEICSFIVRER